MTSSPRPGPDDVRKVVGDVAARFRDLPDDAWSAPAAHLDWSCRETAAHILDDLGAFALQLSGTQETGERYVPLREGVVPRPGGPAFLFWAEEAGGSADLALCLDAVGGLLAAVVATAPPGRLGWHPHGAADASGLAAMGIAETVLHAHDVLSAHGVDWTPDLEVVGAVLDRIFPHAERSARPWEDLLAATGRTDATRGRPWRWHSAPPA